MQMILVLVWGESLGPMVGTGNRLCADGHSAGDDGVRPSDDAPTCPESLVSWVLSHAVRLSLRRRGRHNKRRKV